MADTPIKTKYLAIYHNGENVMEPEKIEGSFVVHPLPEMSNIYFSGQKAQLLMTITHDGQLLIGPGMSTTKATQEVAKLLVDMFERELRNRKFNTK